MKVIFIFCTLIGIISCSQSKKVTQDINGETSRWVPDGRNEFGEKCEIKFFSEGTSTGTMFLNAGDVWKYGETINPATRYAQTFLNGLGVTPRDEFWGNQIQIKIAEKTKIYSYFLTHGHLPPGNKIFR